MDCLSCRNYPICNKAEKGPRFICDFFQESTENIIQLKPQSTAILDANGKPLDNNDLNDLDKVEAGFEEKVRAFFAAPTVVPVDSLIDDSSVPELPNFFEFCTSPDGLNVEPYPMQVLFGARLYNDICLNCTPKKFLRDWPLHDPNYKKIKKNVKFLHHGVCPNCELERSQMINRGQTFQWTQLAAAIGQRGGKCLEYDTLVLTTTGLRRIGTLMPKAPVGWSDLEADLVSPTGELRRTSKFYVEKAERLMEIKFSDGSTLAGTRNHPMWIEGKGWTTLKDIKLGDHLKVHYGQNQWATEKVDLTPLWERSRKHLEAQLEDSLYHKRSWQPLEIGTPVLDEGVAALLGLWVSEGDHHRLGFTNYDSNLLRKFLKEVDRMFPGVPILDDSHDGTRMRVNDVRANHAFGLLAQCMNNGSEGKVVPDAIFQSPRTVVRSFLQHLYEGDGGINGPSICYYTISKELAMGVRALLLNLGVPCHINTKDTWATNGTEKQVSKIAYEVDVSGIWAQKRWIKAVGFLSKKKKAAAQALVDREVKKEIPHYYDKFPGSVKAQFLGLVADIKAHLKAARIKNTPHTFYGVYSMWDRNSSFYRIFADNVALARPRLESALTVIRDFHKQHVKFPDSIMAQVKALDALCKEQAFYVSVMTKERRKIRQKSYDVTVPVHHSFTANGMLSHNSAVAAMMYAHHTHILLKLQQPAKVYKLLPNQVLQASIVAITFQQAVEALWQPLHGYLTSSPWFNAYTQVLKDHQARTGDEQFKLNDTFAVFKHRRIEIRPQSPNVKTLRGRTRYMTGLDEIGWLDQNIDESGGKVKMNAKGIHGALDRSLLTVRSAATKLIKAGINNVPTGINLNISSVADARDMIMTLYKQSLGSATILGYKLATWDVNPNVPRDDPEIVEAFRNNAVDAARDYGSDPPLTANAFFSKFSRIEKCFVGKPNGVTYKYKGRTQSDGTKTRFIEPIKIRKCRMETMMAFDAGFSNNSFAFATGYLNDEDKVVINVVGECQPRPEIVIDHSLILDKFFGPLFGPLNTKLIASDRWQNIKMSQDADRIYGVPSIQCRLKYSEMVAVRQAMWDGDIILPSFDFEVDSVIDDAEQGYPNCFDGDPMRHLVLQLQTVRDTGSDVLKGVRLTDDIWRCIAIIYTALKDEDVIERYFGGELEPEKQWSGQIGSMHKVQLVNVRNPKGGSSGGGGGPITLSGGTAFGSMRRH